MGSGSESRWVQAQVRLLDPVPAAQQPKLLFDSEFRGGSLNLHIAFYSD